MAPKTRPCQRCRAEIPAARIAVLPETRLCIECSEEVGSDFEVSVSAESIGKAGSLKKNYGGINVRKRRRPITPKEE
jgi:Prokaryotic dksA/traR C4-type zinc finger